jgi:ATP-dependent Clp protease adaptor protein ClpS
MTTSRVTTRAGAIADTATATATPATADPAIADPATADADPATEVSPDRPWITIVWDDPINLMSYVTHVFMTVFGYSKTKATALMLDVHERGKAVVSTGPRERMEMDASRLHGFGLWATVSHDS